MRLAPHQLTWRAVKSQSLFEVGVTDPEREPGVVKVIAHDGVGLKQKLGLVIRSLALTLA